MPWTVEIMVEGVNLSRFAQRCADAGINLSRIRRVSNRKLCVMLPARDLSKAEGIAYDGGWTLHRGKPQGWGRVVTCLKRRWVLAAALMAACAVLVLCGQIMWRVEITGAGVYQPDICRTLTEMGVTAPRLRRHVDVSRVQQALEYRYPRIAWFECGWRGTTLCIRAVEGMLPRTDIKIVESCDVVADRDAIIRSIVTISGTPVVQPGDLVRIGEVLIKGEERTGDGAVKPVAADGTVIGRAWIGAAVEMPLRIADTTYTGRQHIAWTVRTPWFDLWKMDACPYEVYDVAVSQQVIGGIFIPIKLHVEKRIEAVIQTKGVDVEQLCAEAKRAAVRKLHEKLGLEESLIDIWGNCSMIDDEKVHAQAIGEVLVEIGVQRVSPGMAAPGQASAAITPE